MMIHLDPATVKAAQEGDQTALQDVARQCQALFESLRRREGAFADDYEDVVVEATETVLRRLPDFGWRALPTTWAIAIFLKVASRRGSQTRKRAQRYRLEADRATDDGPSELDTATTPATDTVRGLLSHLLLHAVTECLQQLNLRQRAIWVLRRLQSCSGNETATYRDTTESTVGKELHYADKKMRSCLESKGYTRAVLEMAP